MGLNFIGPDELCHIAENMGIIDPFKMGQMIPEIPFEDSYLEKVASDFILILMVPLTVIGEQLTIEKMRLFFGFDPLIKEPCFYNQDWYLKEDFATKETLVFNWCLIKKLVYENSRGIKTDDYFKQNEENNILPSAVLCAYSFFVWYFHTKSEMLWKSDYIWCKDRDCNGDQIYVGRYSDPQGVNKNGFSIHRHLSIKPSFGVISVI